MTRRLPPKVLWISGTISTMLLILSALAFFPWAPTPEQAALAADNRGAKLDEVMDMAPTSTKPAMMIDVYPLSATACVSETVTFWVVMTNTGDTAITQLAVTDIFSTTCLSYQRAEPPADETRPVLGEPEHRAVWSDVTQSFGDLEPGRAITLTVFFHAAAPCQARNRVRVEGADRDGQPVVAQAVSDSAIGIEAPSMCLDELVTNGDFESGNTKSWILDTDGTLPTHAEVIAPGHDSSRALFLGNGHGEATSLATASARQRVYVPQNAAGAILSFWYKTESAGGGDVFAIEVTSGSSLTVPLAVSTEQRWTYFEADLSAYRGQVVDIAFVVLQDGQAPPFGAYVDDIALCLLACESVPWQPPEPPSDWCLPAELLRYPDYAPEGMPDFDQRQGDWVAQGRWYLDGPIAVANALWWLDSRFEVNTSPPPAKVDHYPLVSTYRQTWDDHDPRNVVPLAGDLAHFMDTGPKGTSVAQLHSGLRAYIASKGLDEKLMVMGQAWPSVAWLRDVASRRAATVIQIGFWEQRSKGPALLGCHYATVAQVDCDENLIALSDPFQDRAEAGFPGYMRPWAAHGHPFAPPNAVHNDAAYVSHDVYDMTLATEGWQLEGYPADEALLGNFLQLNVSPDSSDQLGVRYRGGPVRAAVHHALAVVPRSDDPAIRVLPSAPTIRVNETVTLELVVHTGDAPVERVHAYLDYDPDHLQVVDNTGNPAEAIIPGSTWRNVVENQVDAEAGTIGYVAALPGNPVQGRRVLARVRLKARGDHPGADPLTLAWSWEAPRETRLITRDGPVAPDGVDGVISIAPSATMTGQVQMQGRPPAPDPSYAVPLTVQFWEIETAHLAFSRQVTATTRGDFALEGLLPGLYDISVKGLHTLGRRRLAVPLPPGETTVNWGELLEGDVNSDNRNDILDASLLGIAYGLDKEAPGFNPKADLDADGQVDGDDVQLLTLNYGWAGDIIELVEPTVETKDEDISVAADGGPPVTLALVPASVSPAPGETFALSLRVASGERPFNAVEANLRFDPATLSLIDVTVADDRLAHVYQNDVDAKAGRLTFAAGTLGEVLLQGHVDVATLRFRVAPTGVPESWILFQVGPEYDTQVADRGEPLLGDVAGCQVTVAGVPTLTRTPTPSVMPSVTATPKPTGTPTVTVPACEPIFADDFNDGDLAGWTANRGSWINPGNVMRGEYDLGNAWNMVDAVGEDLVYEGWLTLRSGNAMGLVFRASADGSQGYDLILDAVDGVIKLGKRTPYTVLGSYGLEVAYNRPYFVQVIARGARLEAYLDGREVLTVRQDTTFERGHMGVLVFQAQADFDDLRACALQVARVLRLPLILRQGPAD